MVTIGNKPILWHIMKIYAHYGFKDFILCLGYKGEVIKEYFLNYDILNSDFTIKLGQKKQLPSMIHPMKATGALRWRIRALTRLRAPV